MSYKQLKGLQFVTVIPTIETQKLHRIEVPAITGPFPEGMAPTGYSIAFTYNSLMINVGFHKIERHPYNDTIMISNRSVARGQSWDMGGSYFRPLSNEIPDEDLW